MKSINYDLMKKLNRKLVIDGVNLGSCNCSWRYDIHIANNQENSAYKNQEIGSSVK